MRAFQGLVHLEALQHCTGCLRSLQHAWLKRWVVDGEVAPAALKRKEQEAARASTERVNLLLASVAAVVPLAILVALRIK